MEVTVRRPRYAHQHLEGTRTMTAAATTAVLTLRCSDKGKLIGHVHEHADGRLELVVRRAQVATEAGWFDQGNLRGGDRYAPSGDGEISVVLNSDSPFANASFSASCGCRQRVLIIPSHLRRAVAEGSAELRLDHTRQ